MAVTGTNFVRFTRHGLQTIRRSWAKIGDRFEVRRQALKLRFWDERHLHVAGMLFDHTYESIKALSGLGIYELRVDDEIDGQSNIRVVFFDPPSDWQPVVGESRPLGVGGVTETPERLDGERSHAISSGSAPDPEAVLWPLIVSNDRFLEDHNHDPHGLGKS